MNVTNEVVVDLLKLTKNVIHVVQDDSTRRIRLKILCGESPYDIASDLGEREHLTGLVAFRMADGHGGEYDKTSDGKTAVRREAGSAYIWTVQLDQNVFSAAGWCQVNVKFRTDSGKILHTFAIDVDVQPSASPESGASDFYNVQSIGALRAMIDELRDRLDAIPDASETVVTKQDRQNDLLSVSEILKVAKSYYDARGTADNPLFIYNQTDPSCFDEGFSSDPDSPTKRNIDCSTFVGLLLRGIDFDISPYKNLTLPNAGDDSETEPDDGDDGSQKEDSNPDGDGNAYPKRDSDTDANPYEYPWAVDPYVYKIRKTPDSDPTPLRTASQLGEWMARHGMAIPALSSFENVRPGDIIFWAKTLKDENGNTMYDEDGNPLYKQPDRYLHISHVAMCYSVKPQPEDVTTALRIGVEIESVNATTALSYLETHYDNENNTYSVYKDGAAWKLSQRLDKDPDTGEWTWGTPVTLTKASTDEGGTALTDGKFRLVEIGVILSETGDGDHSFRLVQYYWERGKYPLKHTMMEVTSYAPYVLNRTLEKISPDEVALVCRPDLGSIRSDVFVGNIINELGINNINYAMRDGHYYLTSEVTGGLTGTGYSNGLGLELTVETTRTKHGKIYTMKQTLQDARENAAGKICIRTQYCYSHDPDSELWGAWRVYMPTT